jgi:small conductance mechanosensitive channel
MRRTAGYHEGFCRAAWLSALCWGLLLTPALAAIEQAPDQREAPVPASMEEPSAVPAKVDVQPVARDEQIRERIQKVLDATGWFTAPVVQVEDGVVFLGGESQTEELRKWAGDLARNTQDVTAVVNRMVVPELSPWDFSTGLDGLSQLWRDFLHTVPSLLFGLLILLLSAVAAWQATRGAHVFLHRRVKVNLLRSVLARVIGLLVFLIGLYVVLRVSGLTQLALTVIGGTGLVGLALGIAFREITENFLASIFLSMQRPFATGDLIEVADVSGYVQQLNVRATVLMTVEGHLVQIPNAKIYKSTIRNFTANPNRRESFLVGIGYENSITEAQEIARRILEEHPAILNDPEPLVLTEELGRATVNLRVYFWLNGHEHSWVKVRSSLIRLVKRAFEQNGISMPDESREVIFPDGVPVTLIGDPTGRQAVGAAVERPQPPGAAADLDVVATRSEAGLSSEAVVIEDQARKVQPLHEGQDLLQGSPPPDRAP